MPPSALPRAGHADRNWSFFDALQLEPPVQIGALAAIPGRRLRIRPAKQFLDRPLRGGVANHKEIPGLHEAHRPGMVRRRQELCQDCIGNRGRQKFPPDVPPLEDGPIHRGSLRIREPSRTVAML